MKSKPMLFSAPMVRALLEGRKTQTRRILADLQGIGSVTEFQPSDTKGYDWIMRDRRMCWNDFSTPDLIARAPHPVGSEIWVRESYYQRGHWEQISGLKARSRTGRQRWKFVPADDVVVFDAPDVFRKGRHAKDPAAITWHKRLGRFMPRWASRITLTVIDVRVQRLQDISEEDAISEGILEDGAGFSGFQGASWQRNPEDAYRNLWESINGPGSWDANPFVWAYTFEVKR